MSNNYPAINTSPLIFLTKGGYLDLLKILSPIIIVPTAVADEIQAYGADDVTAQQLAETKWLTVTPVVTIPNLILNWDLGQGESEVLAYGYLNKGTEILIDDLAARKCAITLNIRFRGTLGIVLLAKQKGYISSARTVMEDLKQTGMYLGDTVINQALSLVNE